VNIYETYCAKFMLTPRHPEPQREVPKTAKHRFTKPVLRKFEENLQESRIYFPKRSGAHIYNN
jgi:hypothetical protein